MCVTNCAANYSIKLYLSQQTDSFCYRIRTDDVYADMRASAELFDFSNYPPTHPNFSNKNKKVIGKMKVINIYYLM